MASVSLQLKPFSVPSEVVIDLPGTGKREDGMKQLPTLKLNQLAPAELEAMISEWAEAVMAAAQAE